MLLFAYRIHCLADVAHHVEAIEDDLLGRVRYLRPRRLDLAYLDEACKRRKEAGGLRTLQDLIETVHRGAVERIRPMAMIGLVDVVGLFPVMWATGTNVMKRIAAPQVGGVLSAMSSPFVISPIYVMWRWWKERRETQIGMPVRRHL